MKNQNNNQNKNQTKNQTKSCGSKNCKNKENNKIDE